MMNFLIGFAIGVFVTVGAFGVALHRAGHRWPKGSWR